MGDWQERANKRREERATKAPDGPARSKRKKDTKRWCKGVEGREHTPVCQDGMTARGRNYLADWRYLICTTCGKELDIWYGKDSFIRDKPKPDWVTD
jgi:hypothetical protein